MSKEAMKLALEALENFLEQYEADLVLQVDCDQSEAAITFLRQAIAEAEKQEQGEPTMNPKDCAEDVFKHGTSMGLFVMPKEDAEQYCKDETKRTGYKHDWHYVAGRVHVKALIPQQPKQEQGEPVTPFGLPLFWDAPAPRPDGSLINEGTKEHGLVGEILLTNGDYKEVSWKNGKLPPVGARLYTHPQPVPREESVIREVVVNADYREMWTEQVRINQRLCAWFRTSQINAAQEPLTDEEIRDCLDAADQMYCEHDGDKEVFKARAIEAAHGIKE